MHERIKINNIPRVINRSEEEKYPSTKATEIPWMRASSSHFPSGHVWMWELDYKENRAQKNWCFWTVVLEETVESPLDCKEIQPVHPKGDQSWVFIGRNDAKAETPIFWPPDVKNWLIWKHPNAGNDWRQEEKGMTEDEMAGWHHWLNGLEFEWTPGVGDGQGGLACCNSWGRKESDMTERLNWTDLTTIYFFKLHLLKIRKLCGIRIITFLYYLQFLI